MKLLKSKTNDFLDLLWKMFHLSSLLIAGSLVIVLLRYFLADNSLFIWHNAEFIKVVDQLPSIPFMDGFKTMVYIVIGIWLFLLAYPGLLDYLQDSKQPLFKWLYDSYNDYFAFYPSGEVKVPFGVDNYGDFFLSYIKKTIKFLWLATSFILFCEVLRGNHVESSWVGKGILAIGVVIIVIQMIYHVDMGKGYLKSAIFKHWEACFNYPLVIKVKYKSDSGFLYLFSSGNLATFYVVFFKTDNVVKPNDDAPSNLLNRFDKFKDAQDYINELIDLHIVELDPIHRNGKEENIK